jgi:NADH oxidase (H2O2-forming)
MAALVKSRLEACAVELFTSEEVFSINGNERVESVSLKEKEIKAELVLIAIGIKPNTKLAQKAGIEIGKYGGILVDSKQRVRKNGKWLNDVYALGDCVEVKDRITGVYTLSPIVSTAVLQARVIAENICGEDTSVDSYLSPYIMRVGDLEIGKVGLSLKQTEEMGINVKVGKATGHTKVNYYPDAKKLTIKLVSDGEYLLGAQIVGGEDVKERINAITSLIHSKIKVKDILYMERCFTPSLCTSRDAFQKAIEEIIIS